MSIPLLKLAPLFEDLAILPADRPFFIWGGGRPGARITVKAGFHTVDGRVDERGQWELLMPPLSPGRITPFSVESGPERVVRNSLLAGDLWLCAGQSNMAMSLQQTLPDDEAEPFSGDPSLRLFLVDRQLGLAPGVPVTGAWRDTFPEPATDCPALPFHFGCLMRRQLGERPLGLVVSAVGDTPIEAWMSREALGDARHTEALDQLEALFRLHPDAAERMPAWQKAWRDHAPAYNQAVSDWMGKARQARAVGLPPPPRPERPPGPGDPQDPTVLFHGMIAPLLRLPIRGIVWYQGETDAIRGEAGLYARRFKALIRDFRRQWAQPELPFIFVQLPRHDDIQSRLPSGQWALLREAQGEARSLSRVSMVVGLDQGDSEQIHPKRKRELAKRLASVVLARVYGCDTAPCASPEIAGIDRQGSRITIQLRHAETGLCTSDGRTPRGFELAGPDACYVEARTDLETDRIILWSEHVSHPHAVRYAWGDDPDSNVCVHAGWPLAPFRCRIGETIRVGGQTSGGAK